MSAQVIADDEVLAVAASPVTEFRAGAATRDFERRLPRAESDRSSASALSDVTVPDGHGAADVRARTLAEILRLLGTVDAGRVQMPQSHRRGHARLGGRLRADGEPAVVRERCRDGRRGSAADPALR